MSKKPPLQNLGVKWWEHVTDTIQHNKPHVHVTYGEYRASVGIDGELLAGSLPQKQFKMLVGWLALHEEEAYAAWNKAVKGEHFDKIKPLQ